MDSYPPDGATTRGGDGVLNTLDLITTLRRVTSIDTSRPRRLPRTTCSSASTPAAERRRARAGSLQIGNPLQTASGWSVPVYIQASSATTLQGLAFAIVSLGGGVPGLSWQPGSVGSPSLMDRGVPGSIALAWLQDLNLPAGQSTLLGYMVSTGAGAPQLSIPGVSAHDAGRSELTFSASGRIP
jgi:hypothetical protein